MSEQIEMMMRQVKLGGLAKGWRSVPFVDTEQYVADLLKMELQEREANRINRMVKTAGFRVLKTLDEYMPACVSYTRPQGGLFLWCTLPERIDMNDFVKKALTRFVAVVPGTAFNCDEKAPSHAFRVTYATPTEEQIVAGVKILASLVQEMSD